MFSSHKTYSDIVIKHGEVLEEFVIITAKTIKTGTLDLNKGLDSLLIILKGCGKDVKEFNWICDWDCDEKISQKTFLKLLKLMPNLASLKLRNVKLENPRKKLKLDLDIFSNLKFIDCDDENLLNFSSLNFAQHFVKNSHSKLSFGYYADYEDLINIKTPQTDLIKKLEVNYGKGVKEILKFANLEDLKVLAIKYEKDFIKEISTLKNLKKLKFDGCKFDYSAQSWKCLEDFENLESLSFNQNKLKDSFLRDLKLKSLRKLSLRGVRVNNLNLANLAINSPNLRVLKVHSSPCKINFYAKHFENLEKLDLEFKYSDEDNSIELNTGTVNESLKELKILYYDFNDRVNDVLEIVEIFPNLESIEIGLYDCNAPLFADKFLFAKLNKLKNLKSLKCGNGIFINRCKNFIVDGALIDDLKSLSKKLEFYDFGFQVVSDKVREYEKVYIDGEETFPTTEIERKNFKRFLRYLKEHFEVKRNDGYFCKLKKQ